MYKFLKYIHYDWKGHEVMSQFNSFKSFVKSDFFAGEGPGGLFKPQWFWLRDEVVDNQLVDYIGRVERIDDDMQVIESRISPSEAELKSGSPIGRQNVSKDKAKVEDRNDSDVLSILSNKYRIDFDKLGYEGCQAPSRVSGIPEETIIPANSLSLMETSASPRLADGMICCSKFDGAAQANKVIFYGPYIPLPSGCYQLAIKGSLAGEFRVRLTAEQGKIVLEERKIWSTADRITFSTYWPIVGFEVLMIATPRSEKLSVEKIILTRTW